MLVNNTSVFFDPITHSYINNEDKFLLGVTSLMKKHGLSPDYGAIPLHILENAAKRGSMIHNAIEDFCKGRTVGEPIDEVKQFQKLNLDVLENEYLVSDNELIASSIDLVLSDYSLGDIKTTSRLHKKPLSWQLSIYAYYFEAQNPGLKVPRLFAIHIRNGVAKEHPVERIDNTIIEKLISCERKGEIFNSTQYGK